MYELVPQRRWSNGVTCINVGRQPMLFRARSAPVRSLSAYLNKIQSRSYEVVGLLCSPATSLRHATPPHMRQHQQHVSE